MSNLVDIAKQLYTYAPGAGELVEWDLIHDNLQAKWVLFARLAVGTIVHENINTDYVLRADGGDGEGNCAPVVEAEAGCEHEPDYSTATHAEMDIIDVNCSKCGMSGSAVLAEADIQWE